MNDFFFFFTIEHISKLLTTKINFQCFLTDPASSLPELEAPASQSSLSLICVCVLGEIPVVIVVNRETLIRT